MTTMPGKEPVEAMDDWTKPAFIRRVRIRGYKSIAFCDVPLQPLTILVGRNAAGKSNFLDALAFLRDVVDSGATAAVKRHGGWSSVACRKLNAPTIEIEIEAAFTCGAPCERISDRNGPSVRRGPQMGQVPDLTGRVFSATYGLEIAAGVHAAPTISRESLQISDETRRLNGGFEVDNGVISRWRSKLDSTEPLSLPHSRELVSARRPDLPVLSIIGTQPFVELSGKLALMGFYNFSPDAIRSLQKPNPGWELAKDGSNLASAIAGLREIDQESLERVRDYLRLIAEEVKDFEAVRYGEFETVHFRVQGGTPDYPWNSTPLTCRTGR